MHVMAVVGGHELHSCACKPRERFVASFACATCRHAADQGRDAHSHCSCRPSPGILSNHLLSDPRLTDAIDDDPRNHFRTPISGTTRLARRAAVHQYGSIGEMDSAPLPASGASLDVVVNELPMDFNGCFICTNGEPVSPHTRRPYCGHGARTVGGGVTR